ncbi:MAG TPA: hypothetical protein VIM29_11205 [Bacillota bacterium]
MQHRVNEEGFTIIELLIATMLLGFVVVAFFSFFTSVINSPRLINENNLALNLARDRLEFLRQFENHSYDRDSTVWNTCPDGTTGVNPVSYTVTKDNIEFTVTSQIHSNTDSTLDATIRNDLDLIPVTVTVGWMSNGKKKSISSTTIFSKKY